MIYVMTSKDGIFYEKIRLKDDKKLVEGQIEVDENIWINAPLPSKLIDGNFIQTDEYPTLEFPEQMEILQPDKKFTPQEEIEILKKENSNLKNQLTSTQLALCDVYEELLTIKKDMR